MSRLPVMMASLLALTGSAVGQANQRGGGMTIGGGTFTRTYDKRSEPGGGIVRDSGRALAEVSVEIEGGSSESTHKACVAMMNWSCGPEILMPGSPAFDTTLRGTVFFRRVVDDGTPRGLQPFLQRVGSLTLAADVGITTSAFSNIPGDDTRNYQFAGVTASTDAYLSRYLAIAVTGSFKAIDASVAVRSRARLGGSLGLRFGDLRLDLGGEVVYNRDTSRDFYGEAGQPVKLNPNGATARVRLDLRVVLLEHIELRLGGSGGPDGGDAYFLATYYAGWRLGLSWGGGGGGTIEPQRRHDTRTFNLRVGLSYWLTRGWSATLQFTPSWSTSDLGGSFDQRVIITLTARIG